MEFLTDYGLFLAKLITVVAGILVVILVAAGVRMREKTKLGEGHIEVRHWNDKLRRFKHTLQGSVLDKPAIKRLMKDEKARDKERAKADKQRARKRKPKAGDEAPADAEVEAPRRIYVIQFHGDMRAQAVDALREEVTAVLSVAEPGDEVVVCVESSGGVVHGYGLAASQLRRIRDRELKLTVCIDKVAASGGYMMACVADRIVAAPFAITGSIGVVAQLPNFHRLLKKHDIDYEMLTAGEYKRTLTVLGKNTDKGRAKFQEDIEDIHNLFKHFIAEHRPALDIDAVATGEIWFGRRALERGLVDELQTSDAYLMARCDQAQVYEVKYVEKKPLQERIGISFQTQLDNLILKWLGRLSQGKWYM